MVYILQFHIKKMTWRKEIFGIYRSKAKQLGPSWKKCPIYFCRNSFICRLSNNVIWNFDTQNSVKTKPELFLIRFVKSLLWLTRSFFIKEILSEFAVSQLNAIQSFTWFQYCSRQLINRILSTIKKYCLHMTCIFKTAPAYLMMSPTMSSSTSHLSFFLVLKGRDSPVLSDEFRIAQMFDSGHVINIFLGWNVQVQS